MRQEGGGGGLGVVVHALRRTPCFPSVFFPLSYTSLLLFSFLLSFLLHCFLICFFFFLSSLSPSFFPLLLHLVFFSLCLSPLSPFPLFFFFEINHFLFHPHLFLLFFLRELLVLCALRELLILYALRELLVLYAFYDVIEDTIDCNQP